jgi:hypothetical protein
MMRHSHIEWTFLVKVHLEIISRENNRPTTYVQASVITDPFHELITATLVSYICLKTAFIIIPKNISPALRGSAHERRPPNAEVKYNTDLLLTIKKEGSPSHDHKVRYCAGAAPFETRDEEHS